MPDDPSRQRASARVEVHAVLKDAVTGEVQKVVPGFVSINPKYRHEDGGVDVEKWEARHEPRNE